MKTIIKYQFPIICISVFCFVVSLSGCYSTQPETIDAEDISHQKEYDIYSLTLKDSSKIKEEDLNYIEFIKGFPDSTGKFIYSLYSTNSKIRVDTVSLYKVSKVEIGKSKLDLTATTTFTAVPVLLLLALIWAAIIDGPKLMYTNRYHKTP